MRWSVFIALSLLPLPGSADECEPLSPDARAACLAGTESSNALTQAYANVLADLDDRLQADKTAAALKKAVIDSQEKWVKFRDADCDAVGEMFHGGTHVLAAGINCANQHDEARAKQLIDQFIRHN
jgi:uncharacterized protein YecT (DUF1311 family)